jgi:hypothetical protein
MEYTYTSSTSNKKMFKPFSFIRCKYQWSINIYPVRKYQYPALKYQRGVTIMHFVHEFIIHLSLI